LSTSSSVWCGMPWLTKNSLHFGAGAKLQIVGPKSEFFLTPGREIQECFVVRQSRTMSALDKQKPTDLQRIGDGKQPDASSFNCLFCQSRWLKFHGGALDSRLDYSSDPPLDFGG